MESGAIALPSTHDPNLVLVNGLPGTGKSTLARRYARDRPLTLALDIDLVRGMLGGWLDAPSEAGVLARRMALAMAGAHLAAGRDVVVPQFLGRLDFVLELEQLAGTAGARFVEVVLEVSPEEAVDRFRRRAAETQDPAHADAEALLERLGGLDRLHAWHRGLQQVVAARPGTLVVRPVEGEIERTYRDLLAVVG